MSRVGQTAEKESQRYRGDRQIAKVRKPAVSKAGQTAEKESQRCRGDRQTARATESWRSDFRVEIPATESWRSDFRGEMSAAHRRFREIKTPAMHIPVKMIKAIRITRIKIPGDASAREASPMQQVTMIVTITILMV